MKKIIVIFITLFVFVVALGCINAAFNPKPPKCSDEETKDLVIKISKDYLKRTLHIQIPGNYLLKNITTDSYDSDKRTYNCQAEFNLERIECDKKASNSSIFISYTSQLTDAGEQLVSVYNLDNYYNWKVETYLSENDLDKFCENNKLQENKPVNESETIKEPSKKVEAEASNTNITEQKAERNNNFKEYGYGSTTQNKNNKVNPPTKRTEDIIFN